MELTLIENIKVAMGRKGITQASLAVMVGVSRPTISLMLSGQTSPRLALLERIADTLDMPLTVAVGLPDGLE